jgi:hypothetical protein
VMCWYYYDGDRGRCGCCRVNHHPLLRPLSTPTDFHDRSPIQTYTNILSLTTSLLSSATLHVISLDLFWPAKFRSIPQKDSVWDAYTARETENRQGEVDMLRYGPYGPCRLDYSTVNMRSVTPHPPENTLTTTLRSSL